MKGTKYLVGPDTWRLQADAGFDTVSGKRRRLSRSFRGPAREADVALRAFCTEVDQRLHLGAKGTVADLLERWWADRATRYTPVTAKNYKAIVKVWLVPHLGAIDATKLEATDIYEMLRKVRAGGAGDPRVRQINNVLMVAYTYGVNAKLVGRNPARDVELPGRGTRSDKPFREVTAEEVRALLDACPAIATLLELAARTGMRRGEVCALRWPYLNLDAGTITVAASLYSKEGGGTGLKLPKSDRVRTVPIGLATVEQLRIYRKDVTARAEAIGGTLGPWVFSPHWDHSEPWAPASITTHVREHREAVGLNHVTPHKLRHFYATSMLRKGRDAKQVAHELGHSRASITLDMYAHAIPVDHRAGDIADGLF